MRSCKGRMSGFALSSRNHNSAVFVADKRHKRMSDRFKSTDASDVSAPSVELLKIKKGEFSSPFSR